MSKPNLQMTDEGLIQHFTHVVMDDPILQYHIDAYVRAAQGRDANDDVSDSDAYWTAYTERLTHIALRSMAGWVNLPKHEELVF